MRGGDNQFTMILRRVIRADAFQGFDFAKNALGCRDDEFALLGDSPKALAMARKNLYPEFILEFDDRLRNTWLRREECFGHGGQIEVLTNRLAHEAELMQIHEAVTDSKMDGRRVAKSNPE
jgi:hypothetical protein